MGRAVRHGTRTIRASGSEWACGSAGLVVALAGRRGGPLRRAGDAGRKPKDDLEAGRNRAEEQGQRARARVGATDGYDSSVDGTTQEWSTGRPDRY
jgi:hypothetical protein